MAISSQISFKINTASVDVISSAQWSSRIPEKGKVRGSILRGEKNFVVVTIVAQWTSHIPAKRVARVLFSEGKTNFVFFLLFNDFSECVSEINNYQRKNVDLRF